MFNLKNELENCLKKIIKNAYPNLNLADFKFAVVVPPQLIFGDYSTNLLFKLAPRVKENVKIISQKIVTLLWQENCIKNNFSKIEIAGKGYLNFFIKEELLTEILKEILKKKNKFGAYQIGKDKTVVIDYSSPNVAKLMHVGHLRSTIIGQAIYNIYKFLDYKTIGDNHLGDWGTHFGKLIYAYKNFADKKKIQKNFIKEITKLYVDFNQQAKTNPKLGDYAREETKKFQHGNQENLKIWKYFVKESLKEFNRLYKRLGIKINYTLGESFYQPMLKKIIAEALKKKVAIHSEGAIIIPLEKFKLPPLMIQKSDGATLYGTTDLATIKYRMKKWQSDKIFYVVSNEQAGYLPQVFKAAELLGYLKPGVTYHLKFGMVLSENGKKFSTREGEVVLLDHFIDEAINRAYKIVNEKNPKLTETQKRKIAEIVGMGALKYNDLSQNRLTDIFFNWDKMLDFQGNSAPYLQYTYARIQSILRKAKIKSLTRFNPELLKEKKEINLIRQLNNFSETIERAARVCLPNILAEYLYKLANDFNIFYESLPVLKTEKEIRMSRLALITSVAQVLKNGLTLLGIKTLENM